MSEPLSTNDIEDVVSSVRRLVSTEQRPRAVSRDLGQDKLLLTPSLRVVPEAAQVAPLILDVRVDEAAGTAPMADEAPFVDTDAAVDVMPGVAADDALYVVEAEWEDPIWTEPETALAELALGAEEAELAPELPVAAVEMPTAIVIEPAAFASLPVAEAPAPWAQTEEGWVEEAPIPFVPSRRAVSEEVATEVEAESAAVAKAAGEDDDGPDFLEVEELVEAAAEESTAETVVTIAQSLSEMPLVDAEGNPVTVLDEAALYDIVRQLIREELQGVLGERITRNVRKLVRAEINRALAARSLD